MMVIMVMVLMLILTVVMLMVIMVMIIMMTAIMSKAPHVLRVSTSLHVSTGKYTSVRGNLRTVC